MDPFEVRMQFLTLLRRLNASQQSIQKVVTYALKYFSRCGEDLWDCIVEECQKGTINTRINILYLLDSLCETSLLSKASASSSNAFYVDFVVRDLGKIVEFVVPEGREGLINLMSAVQILDNWRNKRIIDPQKIDEVLARLDSQKTAMRVDNSGGSADGPPVLSNGASSTSISSGTLSRNEIFKRIEEDRERHKRLRERRWVQPVSHNPHAHLLSQLAVFMPETGEKDGAAELTLDIEFDNEWETTSDWNEDDDEAVAEENNLCYPNAPTRLAMMDTVS
ncbi:CTD kinase subunit gamma CTK3-domain-containing protein [Phellopilus nigrolimitatus]|nr:CTD kinase subunit gamma CTK3-domain-containing protein [Phellopilus nigrolimitatus]